MKVCIQILQRVLVNYFYQVHAGLFLFVFFVLFGLPYSPLLFHLSLITGILESQSFLLIVFFTWLLYTLKCTDYLYKQLTAPRQSFLFTLNLLTPLQLYLQLLYVQLMVYLPVLLYAIAIVVVAISRGKYLIATEVVLFNLVILSLPPFVYIAAIQRRQFVGLNIKLSFHAIKIRKPLFLLPLLHLFLAKKQMLVIAKVFSLLVIYGFIQLYQPERYDIRPIQLCLLLPAAAHAAILLEIKLFEEEFLSFTKGFPVGSFKKFITVVVTFLVLLLPEFVLLLKGIGHHYNVIGYAGLLLFFTSLITLLFVILFLENMKMETFIRAVFGVMAGCFFIILYDPGLWLPIIIIALSYALFHSYYFAYEKE